jgi:RimJ/RimL family protein N-acetyltransferase
MIKLDYFDLEPYSNLNTNHKNLISELMMDKKVQEFLGDIRFMIQMIYKRREENHIDNMYMVKRNGVYLGFISLSIIQDRYEVSIGLLPKFRGENLGYLLTQDFCDNVFLEYPNVNELYAKINPNNIGSIKTAELSGFVKDEDGRFVYRRVPIKKM